MKNAWSCVAGVVLLIGFLFGCRVVADDEPRDFLGPETTFNTGVWAIPSGFPRHGPEDVTKMFERISRLGNVAQVTGEWSKENVDDDLQKILSVASYKGLNTFVALELVKGDRDAPEWDLPKALRSQSFDDPALERYFSDKVATIAREHPEYFALAMNVNRMSRQTPDEYKRFAELYEKLYRDVKKASPDTKVLVTFDWEVLRELIAAGKLFTAKDQLAPFSGKLDAVAFHSKPYNVFAEPGQIDKDYYADIRKLTGGAKPLVVNVGWPAAQADGQEVFIGALPQLLEQAEPDLLIWNGLHDIKLFGFIGAGDLGSMGLLTRKGEPKDSFYRFQALSANAKRGVQPDRDTGLGVKARPMPEPLRVNPKDKFGIYTARLNGTDMEPLISDPVREINHARVSPDREWVVFTRYNKIGKGGVALEVYGYDRTEIVVMRLDGSEVMSLTPPRKGIVAANGYWTPDGEGILFISNDNPERHGRIALIDWDTKKIKPVDVPEGFSVADPHQVGDQLVFPRHGGEKDHTNTLWMMEKDGSDLKQLTSPKLGGQPAQGTPLGDHDPKLSPDKKYVAAMRHVGKDNWHIVVVNTNTGEERDLSPSQAVDAVPEWSSDGRLLLFWHVNPGDHSKNGLYTMKPDGSDRKRVPLPKNLFYTMPAFFPDSGSGPEATIIFTARRPGD